MIRRAFVRALLPALCGCVPLGDCWPEVSANVTIEPRLPLRDDATLFIVTVTKVRNDDVTGTNEQGIPIGNDKGHAEPVARGGDPSGRSFRGAFRGMNTGPTWYYAFADLNGNRTLDPGEPFGVDPGNPHSVDCTLQHTSITLDRIYACSQYGYWKCWPSTDSN